MAKFLTKFRRIRIVCTYESLSFATSGQGKRIVSARFCGAFYELTSWARAGRSLLQSAAPPNPDFGGPKLQLDPSLVPQGATAKINCAYSSTAYLACMQHAAAPTAPGLHFDFPVHLPPAGHAVGTQNYTASSTSEYVAGGAVADFYLQNGTAIVGKHFFISNGNALSPVFTKTDAQVSARSY